MSNKINKAISDRIEVVMQRISDKLKSQNELIVLKQGQLASALSEEQMETFLEIEDLFISNETAAIIEAYHAGLRDGMRIGGVV